MAYYANHSVKTLEYAGKTYTFDFGKYATLTNASCVVTCGETSVLVTAVMTKDPRDVDFMPLMVNYQEKFYAAGKLLGSRFMRREARPSNAKILTQRVIDRSLRPLFPKHMRHEVQIMLTILAYDGENDHDICATLGASACLSVSDIPWAGPLAAARVGLVDNELVVNPSVEQQEASDLDLFVASTTDGVVMVEAGANQISEEKMLEAIDLAKVSGQQACDFFTDLQKEMGQEKMVLPEPDKDDEIKKWVLDTFGDKFQEIIWNVPGKRDRMGQKGDIFSAAKEQALEKFGTDEVGEKRVNKFIRGACDYTWKKILRDAILNEEKRIAGRKLDEIRPINVEVDMFARLHGSGLFQRGETQGLSVVTLGAPRDYLVKEGIEGSEECRYFHHYNFPPFSVGEASFRLMTGNREIGHGALAERALLPVLPKEEDFPYTVRVVTEILMSNGSSSMAATCGSTLALMSAGVPITAPVGGIAMGMITSEDGATYKILSDIQDDEDFVGDMDFKVTGTKEGITAIQMDIKVLGLKKEVFADALKQAHKGRCEIIDEMTAVIAVPHPELSQYAPRLHTIQIEEDEIGKLIGKGGETIQDITKQSGAEVEIKDDGTVIISSADGDAMAKAIEMIESVMFKPKVGETYDAVVARIQDFGAFVDLAPGGGGLVHISKIASERVEKVSDHLKEGQAVRVKLMEIDRQGRENYSIKDAE